MKRPTLEAHPGPVSEHLSMMTSCVPTTGRTTISPENDVVRFRIVAALKEVVKDVFCLNVNVARVSTRTTCNA